MRTILQHVSFAEYQQITKGNTKEEIDSLIWCVEHMPEHLRGVYLHCFLGGAAIDELNDFFYSKGKYVKAAVAEMVTA